MGWFTDTRGPGIQVELPAGYVRGQLPVLVILQDEIGAEIESLSVDGKPITINVNGEIDTTTLPDGEHTLAVEATDNSLRRNTSRESFSFKTDNTPPQITTQSEPPQAAQGRTIVIEVSSSEPITLTGSVDGQNLLFSQRGSHYWSVVGFAPDSKAGTHNLDLLAVDKANLQTKVQVPITVTAIAYPTESLTIPEDRSGLLDPAVSDDENQYLDKIYSVFTPEMLWSGPFMMPVQGVTSSPFAIRRSYNGGPLGSGHGGLDLAVVEGTPVAAASRGRVVLAEPLKVRGNVVILDHGMGVYSAYFHLSSIKVQKGQMVTEGQVIALSGNTGLSTGAHLHWEMRVTGAPVDPREWVSRTMP